ncbi:MAG: flagellin modification protein, PseA [Actinobacteria bacterium]|jgi:N-acetyl sugar amidotransferase|nr:flagellin modification protein, PseA [Actinomycetota bacterium]|tara:strand:- start:1124 stop:2263 length:1140 start_codon:yes stop_codon:yes gene_type:complete
MKYCKKCLFPDTKPELSFDVNGVCDACNYADKKEKINWEQRKNELHEILEKYRNKEQTNYDCVVPVSGGKDSSFQTYYIKKECGLNPLVVNFHPRDFTEIGRKNIEVLKELGVDCIEFSANPVTYKKLSKFGLTELGDSAWPEHIGLFTIPVKIAVAYKIPLLIWGENPQLEYGGPAAVSSSQYLDKEWNEKHGGYFLDKIKPENMLKYGFEKKDLLPYFYPTDEEIKSIGITGIFLGYFIKWDARKQLEIVKKHGFNVLDTNNEGTYTNYENLDTKHVSMHDYFKFLKFGYGRATDHACIDIRNKRLRRDEGLELVKKFEGKIPKKYYNEFLQDYSLTEKEFLEICEKFTNKEIFKTNSDGSLLRDKNNDVEKIKYDN